MMLNWPAGDDTYYPNDLYMVMRHATGFSETYGRYYAGSGKSILGTTPNQVPAANLAFECDFYAFVQMTADIESLGVTDYTWQLLKTEQKAPNETDLTTECDFFDVTTVPSAVTMMDVDHGDTESCGMFDPWVIVKWEWSFTL
jgi:hypothetical protein